MLARTRLGKSRGLPRFVVRIGLPCAFFDSAVTSSYSSLIPKPVYESYDPKFTEVAAAGLGRKSVPAVHWMGNLPGHYVNSTLLHLFVPRFLPETTKPPEHIKMC